MYPLCMSGILVTLASYHNWQWRTAEFGSVLASLSHLDNHCTVCIICTLITKPGSIYCRWEQKIVSVHGSPIPLNPGQTRHSRTEGSGWGLWLNGVHTVWQGFADSDCLVWQRRPWEVNWHTSAGSHYVAHDCLGTHHVDQSGLKVIDICSPLSPGCWDECHAPPCPVLYVYISLMYYFLTNLFEKTLSNRFYFGELYFMLLFYFEALSHRVQTAWKLCTSFCCHFLGAEITHLCNHL